MAEITDDVEIKLTPEDSPNEILKDLGDKELLEEDLNGDDPLLGLDDSDMDDMFPDSDDVDDSPDGVEIDLGMDEIGDLVEDLKLDVAEDDEEVHVNGEGDMVFDEEEINNDSNDSVESLLDAFEDDDDDGEHRVVDDSLEKETPTDPEKDSENDIEQSPESQEEHVPLVTESSVEEEGGDGDDSGESNPSDLIDILDDSDISDDSDQEEDEDMELGMDTLDETKDEELSDLELDTTEIEESVDLDVPAIDTSDETKEVDILDESKEDEITDLGIDDVETVEIENDEDKSPVGIDEVEVTDEITDNEMPDLGIDDAETVEIENDEDYSADESAEVELEEDIFESEAEDIAVTEIATETQGLLEELSGENEEIETEVQETPSDELTKENEEIINVAQETPSIVIVESEMPIESEATETIAAPLDSNMLLNFNHEVVVEIARTSLTGEEITQITYGSIIELDKVAGEPVNLVLNDKTIALGEVVQINNEKLGIRIVGVIQD